MKTFTVVFSILGGDDYTTSVKAASRNEAIKRAHREMRSSFFYANASVTRISAKSAKVGNSVFSF